MYRRCSEILKSRIMIFISANAANVALRGIDFRKIALIHIRQQIDNMHKLHQIFCDIIQKNLHVAQNNCILR